VRTKCLSKMFVKGLSIFVGDVTVNIAILSIFVIIKKT
jgi:hypothetical protein